MAERRGIVIKILQIPGSTFDPLALRHFYFQVVQPNVKLAFLKLSRLRPSL